MNKKIRLLEILLSELVSERDTLEMDLNNILNGTYKTTQKQKEKFSLVLEKIVNVNNKIKTLSEYLTQIRTPQTDLTESGE
tara:strand:- start:258 stop:500 length:243 start_codon:yes stop_codon:yes gene_type:complete